MSVTINGSTGITTPGLASTGTSTAPTAATPTNDTTVATTAFVKSAAASGSAVVHDVTGTRTTSVIYTNTTGKLMFLSISSLVSSSAGSGTGISSIYIDGAEVGIMSPTGSASGGGGSARVSLFAVVPNGSTYEHIFSGSGATHTILHWIETY